MNIRRIAATLSAVGLVYALTACDDGAATWPPLRTETAPAPAPTPSAAGGEDR